MSTLTLNWELYRSHWYKGIPEKIVLAVVSILNCLHFHECKTQENCEQQKETQQRILKRPVPIMDILQLYLIKKQNKQKNSNLVGLLKWISFVSIFFSSFI